MGGSLEDNRERGCNDLPCLGIFCAYTLALLILCALEASSSDFVYLEYGVRSNGVSCANATAGGAYLWYPLDPDDPEASVCVPHCPITAADDNATDSPLYYLAGHPVRYSTYPRHHRCLPALSSSAVDAPASKVPQWTLMDRGGFVSALELRAAVPAIAIAATVAVAVAIVWVVSVFAAPRPAVLLASGTGLVCCLIVSGVAALLYSFDVDTELQHAGSFDAKQFWLAAAILQLLAAVAAGGVVVVRWEAMPFISELIGAALTLVNDSVVAALAVPLIALGVYIGATALCLYAALSVYATEAEAAFAGSGDAKPAGFVGFILVGWLWVSWFLQALSYQAVAVSVALRYFAYETAPSISTALGYPLSYYCGSLAFGALLAPLQPVRTLFRFGEEQRREEAGDPGSCFVAVLDGFLHRYTDMAFAVQVVLGDEGLVGDGDGNGGGGCSPMLAGYVRAANLIPRTMGEGLPLIFARGFKATALLAVGKYAITLLAVLVAWALIPDRTVSSAETYTAPVVATLLIAHGAVAILVAPLVAAVDTLLVCYSYDSIHLSSDFMTSGIRALRGPGHHALPAVPAGVHSQASDVVLKPRRVTEASAQGARGPTTRVDATGDGGADNGLGPKTSDDDPKLAASAAALAQWGHAPAHDTLPGGADAFNGDADNDIV